jgi:hypothetical protein
MGKNRRVLRTLCLALSIVLSILQAGLFFDTARAAQNAANNRFNVVIVSDASGSMLSTDPEGLRFEAINQFINLLAEQGNLLGAVSFADNINATEELTKVDSAESKQKIADTLKNTPAKGDTNIGEALQKAVTMLDEAGDKDLPSIILFLSDGNTDLKDKKDMENSLNMKADAIQAAREKDIAIYSVCLNANKKADVSEMEQISQATGGEFREVGSASDLQEVFNSFYNLIYGTSTTQLLDEAFDESGVLETKFNVPGLGVEEINIIIYGKVSEVELFDAQGQKKDVSPMEYNTFTMIKSTDVSAGEWKLITKGTAGNHIKINMVYNTNLEVELKTQALGKVTNPKDRVKFEAYLSSGEIKADSSNIGGYEAELIVSDAYGKELDKFPMTVVDDHFELSQNLSNGVYFVKAHVSGNSLDKTSESLGPIEVSDKALTEEEKNNTAPVPVTDKIKKTVYIIPFKDNTVSFDLKGLAKDKEDKELHYMVASSSFIEGKDYSLGDDMVLKLYHYSLSRGDFDIKATDSKGLSCNISIVVKSINVGVVTAIVVLIIGLIVLAVMGYFAYRLWGTPFGGPITVTSDKGGERREQTVTKKTGRLPLSRFRVSNIGFDIKKTYFEASGKPYIYMCSSKEFYCNGKLTKRARISNNIAVIVKPNKDSSDSITVLYQSRLKERRNSRRARK